MPSVPRENTAPALTRGRRLAAVCITLVGTLLLGLIGLEVAFRGFVTVIDVPFYFWDPSIGARRAPNQSGRYLLGNHVDGRFNFNAQGWNHPNDYMVAKPEGLRRVALVGDSQVESLQVQPEMTMYAVAERLSRSSGNPVQWYAFGVSGFGIAEEYEVIRRYALDYRPDVVILLFVWNDPFDTSPYLGDLEPYTARYVLDEDEELSFVFPSFWQPRLGRRLSAQSAVVRYFMLQRRLLDRLKTRRPQFDAGGLPLREKTQSTGRPLVEGLARMSGAERHEKTWTLIAKLLEAARDESRRRGAVFAIAYRGWADEIDAVLRPEGGPPAARETDPFCLGRRMREMGRECLAPIAARLDIPYLDLTEALRAAVERTGQSHRFPDDNHYSAVGHAAAGEALAEWVETLLPRAR
jgi:hypothetical protein